MLFPWQALLLRLEWRWKTAPQTPSHSSGTHPMMEGAPSQAMASALMRNCMNVAISVPLDLMSLSTSSPHWISARRTPLVFVLTTAMIAKRGCTVRQWWHWEVSNHNYGPYSSVCVAVWYGSWSMHVVMLTVVYHHKYSWFVLFAVVGTLPMQELIYISVTKHRRSSGSG